MVEMRVDQDEAMHIILATLVIALVFTFHSSGLSIQPSTFIYSIAKYVIAVGSGFILHEMAHKYYALRYGARARFQAWPGWLAFALALAIIPQILGWGPMFLFIAPGAVYIYAMRHISAKENGIISLAGPVMNWAIAFVFLAMATMFSNNAILGDVFATGYVVNTWLAFFNLWPILNLDGAKVMAWDWRIWLGAVLVSLFLLGLPATL
jgi:Zn-dependent protease